MDVDVTVAMATIPPRCGPGGLMEMAVRSAQEQIYHPAGGISVALDVNKEGAASTRQRALDAVRTPWVAFLDDDDYLYPQHIQVLWDLAYDQGADYVYSWFDGNNPFPMHRGRQFKLEEPHHTTMTVMVRTELAKEASFLMEDGPLHQDWMGEDWMFLLRCAKLSNGNFAGTGTVTWHYRAHASNTSGLPTRW